VGRSSRSGKPGQKKRAAKPSPASKSKPAKARSPAPPRETSSEPPKPAKPKLRLVNGKLVPADQSLF
jgi:hypothetical protein